MDLFAGSERVHVGRVNDPSRTVPGDVAVRAREDAAKWERVFEVRDKPVSREDLLLFVTRCRNAEIGEIAVVAVAASQEDIPLLEARSWAIERGMSLSVFRTWEDLVQQVLYWSPVAHMEALASLPAIICDRLIGLEVSSIGVSIWLALIGSQLHEKPETPKDNI
jgi:hypothetical protein